MHARGLAFALSGSGTAGRGRGAPDLQGPSHFTKITLETSQVVNLKSSLVPRTVHQFINL